MSNLFDFEDGKGLVPYALHRNGGGKVACSASVDATVHVGANCQVSGNVKIKDRVSIDGRVRISGDDFPNDVCTLIENDVTIAGNVRISGCAVIRDHVEIRDDVRIEGCVQIMHHAKIGGKARLNGWVCIMDSAYVCGNVEIIGNTEKLEVRDETCLRDGIITKQSDLVIAVRKDQIRQEGSARKKQVKTC